MKWQANLAGIWEVANYECKDIELDLFKFNLNLLKSFLPVKRKFTVYYTVSELANNVCLYW